jgi:glycosyltransferase involved in cell wall biosynthesis
LVLSKIGSEVDRIYVVDDACPDKSGDFVQEQCTDARVVIVRNDRNLGVGGAVVAGYRRAFTDGAHIVVKVDGDGQMDPTLIPIFCAPIISGEADYTKGNRFYDLRNISRMPFLRIFGNACLSFMAKFSTGYWNLFDPTNGYTALHVSLAEYLQFEKISERYFFETDMLFRLNTLGAVVVDIPMDAHYGTETSHLSIRKILLEFLGKHFANTCKRLFYNYYLRDLSPASLELPMGIFLVGFGAYIGITAWLNALTTHLATPTGTIMLSVLPTLVGINLLLAFLGSDMASVPKRPIHKHLQLRRLFNERSTDK